MAHDSTEPRNNLIVIYAIAATLFVFVVFFACLYFFSFLMQSHVRAKVELAPAIDLRSQRAMEDEHLYQYAYVDAEAKTVRIPIERALELEIQKPWRRQLNLPESVEPDPATPEEATGAE